MNDCVQLGLVKRLRVCTLEPVCTVEPELFTKDAIRDNYILAVSATLEVTISPW